MNTTIDDSNSVVIEVSKVLANIKKAEKSGTFTRSTQVRYPELRKKASEKPGIILSKASAEYNFLNSNSLIINVNPNEISYNVPTESKYSGVDSIAESFGMFLQNLIEAPEKPVKEIALVSVQKSLEITKPLIGQFVSR